MNDVKVYIPRRTIRDSSEIRPFPAEGNAYVCVQCEYRTLKMPLPRVPPPVIVTPLIDRLVQEFFKANFFFPPTVHSKTVLMFLRRQHGDSTVTTTLIR